MNKKKLIVLYECMYFFYSISQIKNFVLYFKYIVKYFIGIFYI